MSLLRHSRSLLVVSASRPSTNAAATFSVAAASQRSFHYSLSSFPSSSSAVRLTWFNSHRLPISSDTKARSFAQDATTASRTSPLSPPTPSQAASSSSSASSPSPSPPSSASASASSSSSPSSSSFSSASADGISGSAAALSGGVLSMGQSFIDRVQHASQIELYHMSHIALLVGIPVAVVLSPSILVMPLDLALGLLLPWHSHVGLVNVLDDYVPRPYRALARGGLLVVSVLATFGLLKINLCGAGITESVKSLWRQPPAASVSTSGRQQVTVVQA